MSEYPGVESCKSRGKMVLPVAQVSMIFSGRGELPEIAGSFRRLPGVVSLLVVIVPGWRCMCIATRQVFKEI